MNRLYNTPLYYDGVEIGKCEIDIDIKNIPMIRQIMCGVMTENGFEINSIHLYDNILSGEGSSLPNEITCLINSKRNFNNELIKQKQIQTNNNHEFNNFEKTQMVNLTSIKCGICKEKNKHNTYNNKFKQYIEKMLKSLELSDDEERIIKYSHYLNLS